MHHKNIPSKLQRRKFFVIFFRIKLMECKYCFGWKTEDRQTAVTSVPFAARKQLDLWIRGKLRILRLLLLSKQTTIIYLGSLNNIKRFQSFHIVNLITLSINKPLLLFLILIPDKHFS